MPYTFRAVNSDKDKLITDKGGCWSFADAFPSVFILNPTKFVDFRQVIQNSVNTIYISKVTLPSDIRAHAWGKQDPQSVGGQSVCDNYIWIDDIQPKETKTFDVPISLFCI